MPHVSFRLRALRARRFHLAGAFLLSSGLHAAFLLGFNARPSLPVTAAPQLSAESIEAAFAPTEEPPPPETKVSADEAPEDRPAPVSQASLPEPISTAVVSNITTVITPSVPSLPRYDSNRFAIPVSQVRQPEKNFSEAQIFSLADLDRRPEILSRIEPIYPAELATAPIKGIVIVHFIVNRRGQVVQAEVVSTPHPLLGYAVVKAVARWQFRAGIKSGQAVSTEMELPVRFTL